MILSDILLYNKSNLNNNKIVPPFILRSVHIIPGHQIMLVKLYKDVYTDDDWVSFQSGSNRYSV